MERDDGKKYEPTTIVYLVISEFGFVPNNQITE